MSLRFPLLLVGLLLLGQAPLSAATWQNTGSAWAVGANWGGTVPGANDSAVLPAVGTPVNPNLTANQAVNSLSIDNSLGDYSITQSGGTRTLTIGGGALTVSGAGSTAIAPDVALATSQTWTVGSGAAVDLLGTLSIGNNLSLRKEGAGLLTLTGTVDLGNPNSQFVNAGGTTRVLGTFAASGGSPRTIAVDSGTLYVNSTGGTNNNVTVNVNGGTLGGIGAIGPVTVNGAATFSPGDPGAGYTAGLFQTKSFISNGANFVVDIGGLTAGNGGTGFHDQLAADGTVTLNGGNLTINLFGGFTPSFGNAFTIITSTGTRTGTFSGLQDGTVFTQAGQQWRINYFTNSVILTAVPEPGVLALLGVGVLGFAAVSWRRKKTAGSP